MADEWKSRLRQLSELAAFLESSHPDSQSTTDEQYAIGLLQAHGQVVARNALLTELLKSYINSHSEKIAENRKYKRVMFIVFLATFILFTAATLWLFLRTDFRNASIPQVVSLLSVGATYIGSIFVAYEIMFKYLFPSDEEKDMISMIKTVIENDLKVEEFTSLRFGSHSVSASEEIDQEGGKPSK